MRTVLVVDDRSEEREEIVTQLAAILGNEATVTPFTGEDNLEPGQSYEHHIASWIEDHLELHEANLIACDKELGLFENLRGLSATPVSSVAADLGIPFCLYSRQADDAAKDFSKYQRLRRWSSEEITLEGTALDKWVLQIASLYRGFREIRDRYNRVSPDKSPPAALAEILEHPAAESRIALYGSGGQGFLIETLAFADQGNIDIGELRARMPRVLGNWLRLSILRFPGILVDSIAAQSYLNLHEDSFAQEAVQDELKAAKYKGPFHELCDWWWREDLDAILEEAGVEDGLTLAMQLGLKAKPCLDEDANERAGYYCMITQAPVSADNSRSGISWFPSGADLARIRKDKFDQITALVGMY